MHLASLAVALTLAPLQAETPNARAAATVPAYMLLQTSVTAMRANDNQAATFAFYAGQLRRRLETALYPPDNEGDESEAVYALQMEIGQILNLRAFDDPAATLRALDDYDAWTPVLAPGFRPMWKSSHPAKNPAQIRQQVLAGKKDFSFHMRQQMALLQDPVYYKQFHIGRDCNTQTGPQHPSPSACTAATQTMLRIEKQRGIEGVATMHESDR